MQTNSVADLGEGRNPAKQCCLSCSAWEFFLLGQWRLRSISAICGFVVKLHKLLLMRRALLERWICLLMRPLEPRNPDTSEARLLLPYHSTAISQRRTRLPRIRRHATTPH